MKLATIIILSVAITEKVFKVRDQGSRL